MKLFSLLVGCLWLPQCLCAQISNEGIRQIHIDGFVGNRINTCIEQRVKKQDVAALVEPFRHMTEGDRWQSEFFGKWLLGAIASYEYSQDPELLQIIRQAVAQFLEVQQADGYIGNYKPENRLTSWDIWGRKYSALSLLSYYRLTGEEKALEAVERLIDGLIKELDAKPAEIATTGNYRGMASCSILEPVVYLYKATRQPKYLEFAERIVRSLESADGPQLVAKALQNLPVAHRFPFPKQWWSTENGHKAYEMMSCYEGLMELGRVTGNPAYLEAARMTAENILATEINIAGSGAAFECWYDGKVRQTLPTYHTMETCVTFTWMQFCARLLQQTGNTRYADAFERTMYNALMAAMKDDGSQISKYSPLEGRRQEGEKQCGMNINCCNANGPRGFALIPRTALHTSDDCLYVNLYLPSESEISLKHNDLSLQMQTRYPQDGKIQLTVASSKKAPFTLALRIPAWVDEDYSIQVNGEEQLPAPRGSYLYLERPGKQRDEITIDFKLKTKVVDFQHTQAVVHGPLVFARDSRFRDGFVDECAVIQRDENGVVDAKIEDTAANSFAWLTMTVPMVLGTDLENPENKAVKQTRFCDFASAGNDWNPSGRYRVWIPRTLHVMSEPYHAY